MPNFDYDEEGIRCPHCGVVEYPDVGFGFHSCPESQAALQRENESFERSYMGERKKIKILIQQEIECWDTPRAIESAQSSGILAEDIEFEHSDDVLEYSIKQTIVSKTYL